jgi:hypothetical protein
MNKEVYEKSLEIEGEEFTNKKEPDVGNFAEACSIIEDAVRFKMEHILRGNLDDPEARREVDKLWTSFKKVRDG